MTVRDKFGVLLSVGDRVLFPVSDVEKAGHPLVGHGVVVTVSEAFHEVFVSEPGNLGAEGWIPAEEVTAVADATD